MYRDLVRVRNKAEIRAAEVVERFCLYPYFLHTHGRCEGSVLLRGVQCLAAHFHIVLPAFQRVVRLFQRVIIARVERDTGKRVVGDSLQQAVNTGIQTGFGVFQRLYQRVHIRLRMLGGAVFLCCYDVSFLVLREQGIEQLLRLIALAGERCPTADRVSLFIFVRVLIQRLIKSSRVDLRRWDQLCRCFKQLLCCFVNC